MPLICGNFCKTPSANFEGKIPLTPVAVTPKVIPASPDVEIANTIANETLSIETPPASVVFKANTHGEILPEPSADQFEDVSVSLPPFQTAKISQVQKFVDLINNHKTAIALSVSAFCLAAVAYKVHDYVTYIPTPESLPLSKGINWGRVALGCIVGPTTTFYMCLSSCCSANLIFLAPEQIKQK